eukprot:GHVU01015249.1.p1 GENE.GHVU01015249.1~~GHVU01015249.1.p1  ORF type:complete len:107 (+),score=6.45 GHVU01015249.1:44-322(+)
MREGGREGRKHERSLLSRLYEFGPARTYVRTRVCMYVPTYPLSSSISILHGCIAAVEGPLIADGLTFLRGCVCACVRMYARACVCVCVLVRV